MFNAADPGAVTVNVQADTDEIRIVLLKDHWQPDYDMPNVVIPKGLSTQREWYLFDQTDNSDLISQKTLLVQNHWFLGQAVVVQHLKFRMRHYLYHLPKKVGYAATAKRQDITGHAQPNNQLVVCVYVLLFITSYFVFLFL